MRMPFGKHKGVPIELLPDEYLDWLRTQDYLHGLLKHLVMQEHERRFARTRYRQEPAAASPAPARVSEIIDAGFKVLCRKHHPHLGGTNDAMRETLEAREYLTRRYR